MASGIVVAPTPSTQKAMKKSRDLAARIPELDGFRALAVWMVVVCHLLHGWALPTGALDLFPRPISYILLRGWLGVDLFFVLSGFLITGILLEAKEKPGYFRNFYGRRVLRIFPVYFAVIAVTFLAYRHPASYFLLSALFLANCATLFGIGTPHGPSVFWSLAVEEHFYLVWPMAVRVLSRRNLMRVCMLICVATPIIRGVGVYYGMDPEADIYPLSWFRFDGLALGALLAAWRQSPGADRLNSLKLAGGMFAASILIVVGGMPFGVMGTRTVGSAALRYTHMQLLFGGAILAAVTMSGSVWTGWLRSRFLRVSSDLSYCVYLIHLSVGDGYHWILKNAHIDVAGIFGAKGALLCQMLFITAVTFGVAALSKKYLEDPFLRLKRYFNSSGVPAAPDEPELDAPPPPLGLKLRPQPTRG